MKESEENNMLESSPLNASAPPRPPQMSTGAIILKLISLYWRNIVVFIAPIVCCPLLLIGTKPATCAFVIALMAIYWMTEAFPLPVTALIPVALFPLLGLVSTQEVCCQYLKDTNMMFIAGLIIAIAVEHSNLHMRIALLVLLVLRGNPKFILLGIMLTTMFLSMWISNLAVTAMMIPIANAILEVLAKFDPDDTADNKVDGAVAEEMAVMNADGSPVSNNATPAPPTPNGTLAPRPPCQAAIKREVAYMLASAFASSIGGCGSLTGTGPNLVYVGILESVYRETSVNYATWMAFNVPIMLLCTVFTWMWLQYLFIGFTWRTSETDRKQAAELRALIQEKYKNMGPTNFHQAMTSIIFAITVVFWFMRDPKFVDGWSSLFDTKNIPIKDATPGIATVIFFFVLPANMDWFRQIRRGDFFSLKNCEPMLTWKIVQTKLPWGVIVLLGGSYAMSVGFNKSGLSSWMGDQLIILSALPGPVIVLVVIIITMAITEVASNTAVATILTPVLNNVAQTLKINPIYLTMPCVVSASYAFMFPMSTPPNALIAVSSERLTTKDMARAGAAVKIICAAVLFIFLHTYGYLIFDFKEYPAWAEVTKPKAP